MDERAKFEGSAEELAKIFTKFVDKHGLAVCTYGDESPNVADAKVLHGVKGVDGNAEFTTYFCGGCCCKCLSH
jgi:hypothetical protein